MDNFELWYRANRAKFASGAPPLTFQGTGQPTKNWTIYGYTSPNLFDASATLVDSGIDRDTGEIVESSGSLVSDWISFNSTEKLFISARRTIAAATTVIFAFYDSEKNYLDWTGIVFSAPTQQSHEVTEIPTSAAFFRVQFFDDGFSNVMINQGDSALPYEAFGGVGVRTANLFDYTHQERYYLGITGDTGNKGMVSAGTAAVYVIPIESNTTYWAEIATRRPLSYFRLFFLKSNPPSAGQIAYDIVTLKNNVVNPILTCENSNYPFLGVQIEGAYVDDYGTEDLMVYKGDSPIQYEPYGYKIPITCGGTTTPIYIGDSQLGEGDSISFAQNGTEIPTISGLNTLIVETAVQPSKVVISAASGMTESLKKYFDYKYGVLKMAGIKE